MDLTSIIEKHIELSIRKDNLKSTIESEKKHEIHARIEGDMAYRVGDYGSEKEYNVSLNDAQNAQGNALKELSQVQQLLDEINRTYLAATSKMDAIQLKEVAVIMSVKKKDIERKIEELSQRRNWAISNGDKAYNNQNFQEEQEYNRISSDCYIEINKLKPMVYYYELFENDLKLKSDNVIEQNFGGSKK